MSTIKPDAGPLEFARGTLAAVIRYLPSDVAAARLRCEDDYDQVGDAGCTRTLLLVVVDVFGAHLPRPVVSRPPFVVLPGSPIGADDVRASMDSDRAACAPSRAITVFTVSAADGELLRRKKKGRVCFRAAQV